MQRKQGGENIAGFGGVQNFWAAKKIRISWFWYCVMLWLWHLAYQFLLLLIDLNSFETLLEESGWKLLVK